MNSVPLSGQGGAATSPAKPNNVESTLNVAPRCSFVSLPTHTQNRVSSMTLFQDIKASDVLLEIPSLFIVQHT